MPDSLITRKCKGYCSGIDCPYITSAYNGRAKRDPETGKDLPHSKCVFCQVKFYNLSPEITRCPCCKYSLRFKIRQKHKKEKQQAESRRLRRLKQTAADGKLHKIKDTYKNKNEEVISLTN